MPPLLAEICGLQQTLVCDLGSKAASCCSAVFATGHAPSQKHNKSSRSSVAVVEMSGHACMST